MRYPPAAWLQVQPVHFVAGCGYSGGCHAYRRLGRAWVRKSAAAPKRTPTVDCIRPPVGSASAKPYSPSIRYAPCAWQWRSSSLPRSCTTRTAGTKATRTSSGAGHSRRYAKPAMTGSAMQKTAARRWWRSVPMGGRYNAAQHRALCGAVGGVSKVQHHRPTGPSLANRACKANSNVEGISYGEAEATARQSQGIGVGC